MMNRNDQLSIEDLERIDQKCCQFEKELKQGNGCDLGGYLDGTTGRERATLLLELLALDIDYRQRRGQRLPPEDYAAMFPDDRDVIDRAFARSEPPPPSDTARSANGATKTASGTHAGPEKTPASIGRYRILNKIASGGFAVVYRGFDEELERDVAIKVPHRNVISDGRHAERFMAEARLTANLNHAGIVPVYDVGRTDQGEFYVVAKFMEGGDLSTKIRRNRPLPDEAASIMAQIADALHCAHDQRLVHRDIKPSNILMDAHGGVYLADFGAAVQESASNVIGFVGTPAYMSPEQARGEGHRVDARTDIFALGVVLYELLTGLRPFQNHSVTQLLADIIATDPTPPSQINAAIPAELERICLKAMSKRAADRYATAREFCGELRQWSEDQQQPSNPIDQGRQLPVVPKGLRSFEATDAEFFLQLLPGPRDRHGMPESIRFWKARIEEKLPSQAFRVGVIFGPSGSGKSSLIKAGCLPRLPRRVLPIYIEADASETERSLELALQKACGSQGKLPDLLRKARKGRSAGAPKILIVIDQFEQWLHAQDDISGAPLTAALRQCDGVNVQCVLLVRDDFWMPLVRFMAELEVPLVDGENMMAVDLFDLNHARKVLRLFGQAYEKLPGKTADMTREQKQFLDDAMAAIEDDGCVSPVRLSLFAEMMKHDTWEPATLRRVGGAEGLGVAFLERWFNSSESPPPSRAHAAAARDVLKALLPEPGVNIRGHFRPAGELLVASGYYGRMDRFEDLLQLLDQHLRLVTPTNPEAHTSATDSGEVGTVPTPGHRFYQLTHDFMVEPIREWVTQGQRRTMRGRAELCLAERVALWTTKPESRQLPGFLEWARIRFFTDPKNWTSPQRKMLRQAARRSLVNVLLVAACVASLAFVGWEAAGRMRAKSALATIHSANIDNLLKVIADTQPVRTWLTPLLTSELAASDVDREDERPMRLALLRDDPTQAAMLCDGALAANPRELLVIRAGLVTYADQASKEAIISSLWTTLQNQDATTDERFRAACLLAGLDPQSPRWNQFSEEITIWLVTRSIDEVADWFAALQPVSPYLIDPLERVFLERDSEGRHDLAAFALSSFLEDPQHSEKVVDLIKLAGPSQLPALVNTLQKHGGMALPLLKDASRVQFESRDVSPDDAEGGYADIQSNLIAALLSLGETDAALPYLRHTADPTLRSYLIKKLAAARVSVKVIQTYLEDRSLEADVRQALVLALGHYARSAVPALERAGIGPSLQELFLTDGDIGVRSAAEWALRRWDLTVPGSDATAASEPGRRNWLVSPGGQTMAVLEYPDDYQPRGATRPPPKHRFAIAIKEVTVKEFARFRPGHPVDYRTEGDDTCPAHMMDWYTAVAYCNWLSEQEGIGQDQWCYLPNEDGKYASGMTIAPDFLERRGYRLPLAAEWLYAASAAARTTYFFGSDAELMLDYAWMARNSQGVHHPVGMLQPNRFGLFDVYGSVKEWAHSLEDDSPTDQRVTDDEERCVIGGCYVHFPVQFRANYAKHGNPPKLLEQLNGFRIARTILASPTE